MFKKSFKLSGELKVRHDLEEKTLSTLRKIEIATDCLKEVKDRHEYLEIKETLEALKKDRELEKKGFITKEHFISDDEAKGILETINNEMKEAEKEYRSLEAKKKVLKEKYKKDLEALEKPMNEIRKKSFPTFMVNGYLPSGFELEKNVFSNIYFGKIASAAAAKAQQKNHWQVVAMATGRPRQLGIIGIEPLVFKRSGGRK